MEVSSSEADQLFRDRTNVFAPQDFKKYVFGEKIEEMMTEDPTTMGTTTISVVELQKDREGFGFNIVGGTDDEHVPGQSSIFISMIRPGGAADRDGRLQMGDRVISINGLPLDNKTHDEAVAAFQASGQKALLTIESDAEQRIVSEQSRGISFNSPPSPSLLPLSTDKLPTAIETFTPFEPAPVPMTPPDVNAEDDAESITSYAPSTHSLVDDVPRTPKRPVGLLTPRSMNILTEALYVTIGLGAIGAGAVLLYRFIRGRR